VPHRAAYMSLQGWAGLHIGGSRHGRTAAMHWGLLAGLRSTAYMCTVTVVTAARPDAL
jgi:hypothetical protein